MSRLKTLKDVAGQMQLCTTTAGRWLKLLKHRPTVNNRSGGYRFTEENAERFLTKWAEYKFKRKRPHKRKRKR